jgi:uncharacterized protein (TIGR02453 family)
MPVSQYSIQPSTYTFLSDLSKNNNREWFANHKNTYEDARQNMIDFMDNLIVAMNQHDTIETPTGKSILRRIYSDVRFSASKAPYTPRFAGRMQRATMYLRGGYYLFLKPGGSYLTCGFFSPNPADLKRIRLDIAANENEWNEVLSSIAIKQNFGELRGRQLKTTPKSFQKDHPAIELLRYQQYIFRHEFKDEEVTAPDFLPKVNGLFQSVRPFFDLMSHILTTDLNGELIV